MAGNYNVQRQQGNPQGFTNSPFFSSLSAASASAASAASAASVESVASVQSADSAATASAAPVTDIEGSISTSIALGVSTTATLNEPEATSAPGTTASTADSTRLPAADTTGSSIVQSTASAAVATSGSSSAGASTTSPTTFETSTTAAGIIASDSLFSTAAAVSLHGSQSGDPTAYSTVGAASEGSSLLPITNHGHHSGISTGALAAAVVVPILFALLAIVLGFLCLRRRNRSQDTRYYRHHGIPAPLPATREKFSPGHSNTGTALAPVLTSDRNNAYFTGLDTSSHGSRSQRGQSGEYYAPETRRSEGGTFADPPPPYKAKSMSSMMHTSIPEVALSAAAAASAIPTLHEPAHEHDHDENSPFADPVSPSSENHSLRRSAGGLLISPVERPGTSRTLSRRSHLSASGRSINSDQYSETASLHSAYAARMSVGGAQIIAARTSGNWSENQDPFHNRHAAEGGAGAGGGIIDEEDEQAIGPKGTGCLTCRLRLKTCDGGLPKCGECVMVGFGCTRSDGRDAQEEGSRLTGCIACHCHQETCDGGKPTCGEYERGGYDCLYEGLGFGLE